MREANKESLAGSLLSSEVPGLQYGLRRLCWWDPSFPVEGLPSPGEQFPAWPFEAASAASLLPADLDRSRQCRELRLSATHTYKGET